ncbi:MAG: photosynthetic complex assembly protein PuhC [Gemmobacter sp.]
MSSLDANAHPKPRAPEAIPKPLLRAMLALALVSLALVSFAVITDRPKVGVPAPAEVVAERTIRLIGGGAQAVQVADVDGRILLDLPHGGFVTVVQNALETNRRRHGIDPTLPVRIVRYANGRLAVEDTILTWGVELYAFGGDNKASFEKLMTD